MSQHQLGGCELTTPPTYLSINETNAHLPPVIYCLMWIPHRAINFSQSFSTINSNYGHRIVRIGGPIERYH